MWWIFLWTNFQRPERFQEKNETDHQGPKLNVPQEAEIAEKILPLPLYLSWTTCSCFQKQCQRLAWLIMAQLGGCTQCEWKKLFVYKNGAERRKLKQSLCTLVQKCEGNKKSIKKTLDTKSNIVCKRLHMSHLRLFWFYKTFALYSNFHSVNVFFFAN